MSRGPRLRGWLLGLLGWLMVAPFARAQSPLATNAEQVIDLPTVLRLARAGNLEVQLAREQLAAARGARAAALWQFLPWLSPGIGFRRHDNLIQDVSGNIVEVHKESYSPGATLTAQVDLGDAVYAALAAKQDVRAAEQGLQAQRRNSVATAAAAYFNLLGARALTGVNREAVRVAAQLAAQLAAGVQAGLAYRGDELRARLQAGLAEQALRRSLADERIAGARLAEALHLDATVALTPREADLVPLSLVPTNAALGTLVAGALTRRPELLQSGAGLAAAAAARKGVVYGPWVPSLAGQAYVGGLGGGLDNGPARFGQSEDYSATLAWKIGPGGLFDPGRREKTDARLGTARVAQDRLRDQITREVVESLTRFRSLADQLALAERNVADAQAAEQLAEQRKEFAVGIVLEAIQTQQDLTRARADWVRLIAEFNQSQFELQRAAGEPLEAQ